MTLRNHPIILLSAPEIIRKSKKTFKSKPPAVIVLTTEAGSGIALRLVPLIAPRSQWLLLWPLLLSPLRTLCLLLHHRRARSSWRSVWSSYVSIALPDRPRAQRRLRNLPGVPAGRAELPHSSMSRELWPWTHGACLHLYLWLWDVLELLGLELPGACAALLATSKPNSASSTAVWAAATLHCSKNEVLCSRQPRPCLPTFPPGWPRPPETRCGAHAHRAAAESGTAWQVTVQGRLFGYAGLAATAQLLYVKPVERATASAMHQAQPHCHSAST